MDFSSDNTIPWHLVGAALQGTLDTEEEVAFQQWLASGAQNRELYRQLKDAWDKDLDEYRAYLQADETVAWNVLRDKMGIPAPAAKKPASLIRMVSIAAIFVVVSGIITWYMLANSSHHYTTGHAEQRSVSLADGTLIKLSPSTRLEVPADYNRSNRNVMLKSGEALFEVRHSEALSFIVELGRASVKDIGTVFRIRRIDDSLYVSVIAGKVEFREHTGNQVRLLSAGMQLISGPAPGNTRSQILVDSSAGSSNRLHFINTALPEVIRRFEEVYSKHIFIIDTALIQKRFTGNLQGQSFEQAMDVLGKTLNIAFVKENDTFYLKKE